MVNVLASRPSSRATYEFVSILAGYADAIPSMMELGDPGVKRLEKAHVKTLSVTVNLFKTVVAAPSSRSPAMPELLASSQCFSTSPNFFRRDTFEMKLPKVKERTIHTISAAISRSNCSCLYVDLISVLRNAANRINFIWEEVNPAVSPFKSEGNVYGMMDPDTLSM